MSQVCARKGQLATNHEYWRSINENTMPELPEVETIKRQLVTLLGNNPAYWMLNVEWMQIFAVQEATPLFKIVRKGKNLCFYGQHFRILNHLRMTGRFRYFQGSNPASELAMMFKHVKAIFRFTRLKDTGKTGEYAGDYFRIIYTDTRGFGVCKVEPVRKPDEEFDEIKRLGIDPTYPEEFTYNRFKEALMDGPNSWIGSVLLRQDVIAGIGNIYRSEILHAAGINPMRKAESFSEEEFQILHQKITDVLLLAISRGGCSIENYRSSYYDVNSSKGGMQKHLAVYGREGQRCLNCDGVILAFDIEKLRRIYYCSNCQR